MTFHVERIDHVVLRVRNLPGMVQFYERALGFEVVRRLEDLKLVQMRAGASMLDLIGKERGGKAGNMDHLCFRIEPFDREAIASQLAPLGIALGDPEGNQIELKGPATSGMPPEGAAQ
jgi:glyoxylase I family protein